jgi:hypothetical protein
VCICSHYFAHHGFLQDGVLIRELLEDAPQVGLRPLADAAAVPHPDQRQGVPCDPSAGRGDSEEFTRVRSLYSGADHDGGGRLDAVTVECHADGSGGAGPLTTRRCR